MCAFVLARLVGDVKIRIRYWREPVQTRDGLPLEGNEVGDARIVLDEKALYVWDGTQWVKVTNRFFIDLEDTPNSYVGYGGQYLRVKATEDGIEFAPAINTFIGLEDTPSTYSGYGKYLVRVKETEDGLEFVDQKLLSKPFVIVPDDFSDIQQAIDFLKNNYDSGIVFLRPQEYTVSSTIVLREGIWLVGLMRADNEVGVQYPRLIANISPIITHECWIVTTPFGRVSICGTNGYLLKNLILDGQGSYGYGISGTFSNGRIINVEVRGFTTSGIKIDGSNNVLEAINSVNNSGVGLSVSGGNNSVIGSVFDSNGAGIEIYGSGNLISYSIIISSGKHGVLLAGNNNGIKGCGIYNNDQDGIGAGGIRIEGKANIIEGNDISDLQTTPTQDYGVYEITGADENRIYGNRFFGNVVEHISLVGANSVRFGNILL